MKIVLTSCFLHMEVDCNQNQSFKQKFEKNVIHSCQTKWNFLIPISKAKLILSLWKIEFHSIIISKLLWQVFIFFSSKKYVVWLQVKNKHYYFSLSDISCPNTCLKIIIVGLFKKNLVIQAVFNSNNVIVETVCKH